MQYSLCMVTNRRGIANGTKLVVRGIHSRVIDAEIATGNREDNVLRTLGSKFSFPDGL